MYLIFDTETTGLPKNYNAPISDSDNWPRMVQLAWQLHDDMGELIEVKNFIIKPEGYTIPFVSQKIHGISTERAMQQGTDLAYVLEEFNKALEKSDFNVGHNIEFDINIVGAEYYRKNISSPIEELKVLDTKNLSTDYCAIPGGKGGRYKWPTLTELHQKLFNESFAEAHNASADVEATTRCFLELIRLGVITSQMLGFESNYISLFREKNPNRIKLLGLNIEPYDANDLNVKEIKPDANIDTPTTDINISELEGVPFTHLHCHSQFSILQSTTDVNSLINKAKEMNCSAIAMTDSGNMYGAFHFVQAALRNGIKPILGCEIYVTDNHLDKSYQNNGYSQLFIAKNKNGYHNISKLSSISYTDGFYYVPRIDKEVLLKYKEDIIVTTGNLFSEIPSLILNIGESQAEEAFVWWKEQFKDDFYAELSDHGLEEEKVVNETLLKFCKKYDVKYIATNNSFYTEKSDAYAQDILLCVKDAEYASTPKKYMGKKGREFRFGLPNDEFYIKTPEQMKQLFAHIPEAIKNTQEIVDKVEEFKLARDVLLPKFEIPEQFMDSQDEVDGGKRGENNYLRHLTFEGAKKRYDEITPEIEERLDFELQTIANTGYPGYFLIVQDFTGQARKMGVSVGPGRGSAAGSAVAYCIGITNVDPIKYDLLFERFLNPDRVSLPDIDIDFDDRGRDKIIEWVVDKYGKNQVAQIITYGTMAAKSSIRDTARVLQLPLQEADRLAKLVPDTKLGKLFSWDEKTMKGKLNGEQIEQAKQLIDISQGSDLLSETINQARVLEGSVRNTGIHACGVIITPDDITNHVPVTVSKDADLLVTQFDNSVVESAGLLKMDFLGLKTLTLIKDAIAIIKARHGMEIDPDEIPLDDERTYELFQKGQTVGIFQYESPGMQKHLKNLKPDNFNDLIAMNALYRPGPLQYIPNFIARKHGEEDITYDLPEMEEYLKETYGITVYQEQVMLLSQKLAGFTKGQADALRKGMGKKKKEIIDELYPLFIEGCTNNGHEKEIVDKIWKDWEAFASYAFNKSHSTCYAYIAFQTAYLKAHYPAEYMAAVLSNNMNDIKSVTFFMEECRKMDLPVLGPDVNESYYRFAVNPKGEIRFGMGAIKGVGEGAVENIINQRKSEGNFNNIFDFVKRVDLKSVNKRTIESLALGGGFDSFEDMHRAQYFIVENEKSFVENAIKYGSNFQKDQESSQQSLFGDTMEQAMMVTPRIPECEPWGTLEKLSREKEVVGIYISGHPLDDYRIEQKYFCNANVEYLNNMEQHIGKELKICGVLTNVEHRIAKNGNPFGSFEIEDYDSSSRLFLFKDDYLKHKNYLNMGLFVYLSGKIQRKRWGDNAPEFNIQNIELLSEVRQKLAKNITLQVPFEKITTGFMDEVEEQIVANPGNCQLKFYLYDTENKTKVMMPSRSKKVALNNEFIDFLEPLEDISYKVN